MISKFISGTHKIKEIERAIASFEFGLYKSIKSVLFTQDDIKGNAISFEETGAIILGEFKLQLSEATTPTGYNEIWRTEMVAEDKIVNVIAWRREELNVLSTVPSELAVELISQEDSDEKDEDLLDSSSSEPTHEPLVHGSHLRYGVNRRRTLTDAGSMIRFSQSPHHSSNVQPILLVIHYTATTTLRPVINWFADPISKVSAHLIIDRDGSVIQMVRFDRRAWHAGISSWGNLDNINRYSIGIELVNAGKLRKSPHGWMAWNGSIIADDEVTEATHILDDELSGWHEYTQQQLESLWQVGTALNQVFDFQDIVGHDMIAPERKKDPGPLFPLESIRAKVLGRS